MKPQDLGHYPVFYREIIEYARDTISENSIVVDCTTGSGGHSGLFLKEYPEIKVVGFERDAVMADRARKNLAEFGDRFSLIEDNFRNFDFYFAGQEESLSFVLYDFGISSYHLDDDSRGFAIKEEDAPLDMRLDSTCKYSAYDVVNTFSEKEIADIIYKYGEERSSRKIARYICRRREESEIETTSELAELVMRAKPKPKGGRSRVHPATKTFQAFRIFINGELDAIQQSLGSSWKYLKKGGRIAAISFHSLEDRLTKQSFRSLALGCNCYDMRYCQCDRISKVKILTKKVVVPGDTELNENPRSRSAKLRVCEKV